MNISSLVLQFGSAALLFWESVSTKKGLSLFDTELQLQDLTSFPLSSQEKAISRVASFLSFLVFFGGVFLVGFQVFVLFGTREVTGLIKAELTVVGSGILLFVLTQIVGKIIQNSINRYIAQMQRVHEE